MGLAALVHLGEADEGSLLEYQGAKRRDTGGKWDEEHIRGIIGLEDLGPLEIVLGVSTIQTCDSCKFAACLDLRTMIKRGLTDG